MRAARPRCQFATAGHGVPGRGRRVRRGGDLLGLAASRARRTASSRTARRAATATCATARRRATTAPARPAPRSCATTATSAPPTRATPSTGCVFTNNTGAVQRRGGVHSRRLLGRRLPEHASLSGRYHLQPRHRDAVTRRPAATASGRRTRRRPWSTPAADSPVELGVKFRSDVAGYDHGRSASTRRRRTRDRTSVSLWIVRRDAARRRRRSNLGAAAGWQEVPSAGAGGDPGEHDVRRVVLLPERASTAGTLELLR